MTTVITTPSDQLCQFENYLNSTKSIQSFKKAHDWMQKKVDAIASLNGRRAAAVAAIVAEIACALFCSIGAAFEKGKESILAIQTEWKAKTEDNKTKTYLSVALKALLLLPHSAGIAAGGFVVKSWGAVLSFKHSFKAPIAPVKEKSGNTAAAENLKPETKEESLELPKEPSLQLPEVKVEDAPNNAAED